MPLASVTPLEADLAAHLDATRVSDHAKALSARSPETIADYVVSTLGDYAIPVTQQRIHRLVSHPGEVYLSLARRDAPVEAVAAPYSGTTPPEGLVAPLHIAARGPGPPGAIVLLTSPPTASTLAEAVASAAVGLVYIMSDEREAVGPSGDGAGAVTIPVVAIGEAAGEGFVALAESGPVVVRLRVAPETATNALVTPIVALAGAGNTPAYIMAGARGTWGTATLLECCRALALEHGRIRRGVRLLWWPADEPGVEATHRYVTDSWPDLVVHAGAYLELTGARAGRPPTVRIAGHPQLRWLAEATADDAGVQRIEWQTAARSPGCAPFAAAGIPAISVDCAPAALRSALLLLCRLCSYPLLPFDFLGVARSIEARVLHGGTTATDDVDLVPLRSRASTWRAAAERLQVMALHVTQGEATNLEEGFQLLNEVTDRINRHLVPHLYRAGDRYVTAPLADDLLPGLAGAGAAALDQDRGRADQDWAARTRERNRLGDALREATRLTDDALESLRELGFA